MTNEEKQLLLRDLCVRLPYKMIVEHGTDYDFENDITDTALITAIDIDNDICSIITLDRGYFFRVKFETIKPYLRPMSSMTEEEKDECLNEYYKDWKGETIKDGNMHEIGCVTIAFYSHIDWLNAHHFDYRGLIEKGLALEAPEGMYNI